MASSSNINLKDRNEIEGESDDDSDYVPGIDENNSDLESVDLGSSDSDSDDDLYNISDSNEEDYSELDQCRVWYDVNMQDIPAPPPRFPFTGNPGVVVDIDSTARPLECFELYFDQVMIDIIVRETNRYADQYISKNPPKVRSLYKAWTPTSENEMRLFLGIMILQGIVKLPRQEWCWSKRKIIHVPVFSELMSRNRFLLLMKFMHFSDNENFDLDNHPNPKLRKFFEVMEHLRNRFREVYVPAESLSLDESLMLYKGRLGWKMFNAKKRARFGLKFFVVCETETGYICDFLLYTGKSTVYNKKYDQFPISTKVVLHLMDQFLKKGYCVTVDNWYMSPELADVLIKQNTDIYGTVNSRRKDLPVGFSKGKLQKGEIQAFQRGKVMALKWQDKKTVCLLSTIHNATTKVVKNRCGKDVVKPKVVCDYNDTMGGVDRSDQEMSYYPSSRKQQHKYYKKIFRHFIDQAIWNSYIIFTKISSGKKIDFIEYRMQLVEDHIEKYSDPNIQSPKGRPSAFPNPLRLTARHFASHIPPNAIKKEPRRQCAVCCSKKNDNGKRIRKETRIWCKDCGVGLCLEPCFEIYHTKKNF
jgi:hypothetical protein